MGPRGPKAPQKQRKHNRSRTNPFSQDMGQKGADQLRQILVPDLQSLVGNPKTSLVTVDLVQSYLQSSQLMFDQQLVRSMFEEADFKREGGLSSGALIAAIQGRSAHRCSQAALTKPG